MPACIALPSQARHSHPQFLLLQKKAQQIELPKPGLPMAFNLIFYLVGTIW